MQPDKSIESKKMRDTLALAEILREREISFLNGEGIPLEKAFAELREEANRKKILYAHLFNNNHATSKKRHR